MLNKIKDEIVHLEQDLNLKLKEISSLRKEELELETIIVGLKEKILKLKEQLRIEASIIKK